MTKQRARALAAILLVAGCAHPKQINQSRVEATFWIDEAAPQRPDVVVNPDHPCGATGTARLYSVPVGPGYLQPEFVREIDSHGSVLRTWPVPIDLIPVAVQGHALLLRATAERWLRVGPNGELAELPPQFDAAAIPAFCPEHVPSGRSAFLRCMSAPDVESGDVHLLAFEGPCT